MDILITLSTVLQGKALYFVEANKIISVFSTVFQYPGEHFVELWIETTEKSMRMTLNHQNYHVKEKCPKYDEFDDLTIHQLFRHS